MALTRRWLIKHAATLLAAPAILRVSNLMPVKAWADERRWVDLRGLPVFGQPTFEGLGTPPISPLYLVDPLYLPGCQVVFDETPMLGAPKRWGVFTTNTSDWRQPARLI
jgi:hypothetical protein